MMFSYIRLLQNPFVLGALGGIVMVSLLYYDDSSSGNQIVIKDYFKLFASTALIVVAMIYLSRFNLPGLLGGSAATIAANVVTKQVGGEEMYAGMPDF